MVSDRDELEERTATAVESLSIVTTTATAAGFLDVAKASNQLQDVIITDFSPTETLELVPPGSIAALHQRVQYLESAVSSAVSKAELPETPTFKCREDFEKCMRNAKGTRQQVIPAVMMIDS